MLSPKVIPISKIFDEYERLHPFVSQLLYNMCVRVVSPDIQPLAFGSRLYIRYNTATRVVNSTCKILIIHEGKTKKISAMTKVVYVIQDSPDLHKLFVRFSQPKSFNIFRISDEYERLHAFGSHTIYNIRVRVASDMQSLAFGLEFLYPTQHGLLALI